MGMSSPDSSRKEESAALRCRICDKPVAIHNSKSDCDGNVFHGECYALKIKLEQVGQAGHAYATRPWKVVAAEVSREQDSKRMTELVVELTEALDEQTLDGTPSVKTKGKPKTTGK